MFNQGISPIFFLALLFYFCTFNLRAYSFLAEVDFSAPLSINSLSTSINSICNLEHWVQGKFEKDHFIPTFIYKNMHSKKIAVKGSYHWFKKVEATTCLANKRIWIVGDSYMRHFYFGMMDVLRGNTKNPSQVIDGKSMPERAANLHFCPKDFHFVRQGFFRSSNSTLFYVGKRFFSLGESFDPLKELLSNILDDDLIVLNLLIHDNKRNRVQSKQFKGNMKKAKSFYLLRVKELSEWVKDQNVRGKFVWATSNSYNENKVPIQFRRYQRNKRILSINSNAREYWLRAGFPVLDVFHITMACRTKTCTNDGSHYNRMVNRAKAQVLLNYFCRPQNCEVIEDSK